MRKRFILITILALIVIVGGIGIGLAWRTEYLDRFLPPNIKEMFGRGEEAEGELGGRVIFVSGRDGNLAIYWVKFDGSDLGKIWENKTGFDDYEPYLSLDKQKIIFLSDRDNQKDKHGGVKTFLYYNDTAGKSLQKLSSDAYPAPYGWLADGSGFVYINYSEEIDSWGIKLIKIPALTVSTLAESSKFEEESYGRLVALSPKSDWIAFNVDLYPDGEIYIIRPDGTGLKKASSDAIGIFGSIEFSEDGKQVIYGDYHDNYYSYDIAAGTETEIPAPCFGGVYSSSQDLCAFVARRDGEEDVYVSREDGTAERRITFGGEVSKLYTQDPFVGPNDRYLLYAADDVGGKEAIYVVSLEEGSEPFKIVGDVNLALSYPGGIIPER